MYMQVRDKDGMWGEVVPYSQEGLAELLANSNTDYVEVFKATEEQIKKRGARFTKKKKRRK